MGSGTGIGGVASSPTAQGARLSAAMTRLLLEWGAALCGDCPRDLLAYIERRLALERAQAMRAAVVMRAILPPED